MRIGARNAITDVPGVLVGHHHRLDADAALGSGWATGATVVVAPPHSVGAVDVRGGGPGTRETDALGLGGSVASVDAITLSGGSAYGLAAADGAMQVMEEAGRGLAMGGPEFTVPIVGGAVIFDLPVGGWRSRPDAEFGVLAARAASADVLQGSVGAGTGARAGALKGGVGTASVVLESGIIVGALMVANPVGDVVDPSTGLPWAIAAELDDEFGLVAPSAAEVAGFGQLRTKGTVLNTTIGVVATNATLTVIGANRVAVMAQDGIARAVRPAHSPFDGDTIFTIATGELPGYGYPVPDFSPDVALAHQIGTAAALCVERAIGHAILAATSVAGIPAYHDVLPSAAARVR